MAKYGFSKRVPSSGVRRNVMRLFGRRSLSYKAFAVNDQHGFLGHCSRFS